MAAKPLTPAEAELVNSMPEDDIPTKLRCAICSRLAVNAFKLPCCEQLIDETCHGTLPSTCPVCEHTPLSAADCNPNKVMRSTIRVFIKTELRKQEAIRAKQLKEASPATGTPAETNESTQSSVTAGVAAISVEESRGVEASSNGVEHAAPVEGSLGHEASGANAKQEDASENQHEPQAPGTAGNLATEESEVVPEANAADVDAEDAEAEAANGNEAPAADGPEATDSTELAGTQDVKNFANGNQGFNGNGINGNFAGMNGNFSGDFNQMQMMMAMQAGMMPNGFNFPMMGMPGMGMDPTMQGMYMNGGFGAQGMGMNGMNGMSGMNNMNMMDGGFGGSGSNNWSGQQSWNMAQDNFNHQNATGMGSGDFGSYNTGFQAGYNQPGNFQQNQFNHYHGFGRGRGRGRGFYNGYGRGGFMNNGFGSHANYGFQGPNFGAQQSASAEENGNPTSTAGGDSSNTALPDADGHDAASEQPHAEDVTAQDAPHGSDESERKDASNEEAPGGPPADAGTAIPVFESRDRNGFQDGSQYGGGGGGISSAAPLLGMGPGIGSQTFPLPNRGGGSNAVTLGGPAPDIPLNAPSGPRAMRQGLPNTSTLHLRARGYNIGDDSQATVNAGSRSGDNSPALEQKSGEQSRSMSVSSKRRDQDRTRERSHEQSPSLSGSRSRGRGHSRSHNYSREASQSRGGQDHGRDYNRDLDIDDGHDRGRDQDFDVDRSDGGSDHEQEEPEAADGRGRGRSESVSSRSRSLSRGGEDESMHQRNYSQASGADTQKEGGPSRRSKRSRRRRGRRGGGGGAGGASGTGEVAGTKKAEAPPLSSRPDDSHGRGGRSRSTSPRDDSRRSGGGGRRSRRERDAERRRDRGGRERDREDDRRRSHREDDRVRERDWDRDHRDRDRDRDRDRERERERDRDRDRDRERERERGDDRSRNRERTRDRDRDRERDRDRDRRDRDRDRDRERDRSRGRDRDRDRERNGRAEGASGANGANGAGATNGTNGVNGVNGANGANGASGASGANGSKGGLDPYAAERERRMRERLAAEKQKIAGISTLVGSKRGRDDYEEGGGSGGGHGGGRRSRRRGRRGEAVVTEDAGQRLRGDAD